jgi:serine/threonine protein kinase
LGKDLPQPGQTLGKYEILKELAIGGMAAIFLARVRGTAGFEKHVVLKVILPNLVGDRALVTMFLEEARLAASLRHSNIADVFDVGNEAKHFYIAMEYVHGENARTLRIEAKQRGIHVPIEVALGTILGTTSALAYAHDRVGPDGRKLDLIHRDISPSNIMISYEAPSSWSTSASRVRRREAARTREPASGRARFRTCRQNNVVARRSTAGPICSRSARCSTS